MPLILDGDCIYDGNGTLLKTLGCPKKASLGDLYRLSEIQMECKLCSKPVFDTSAMNEVSIVELLTSNPEACIKINMFNPLFKVEDE